MKVTVNTNLNVRVGKPSVNAPCYQYLAPGSILEVDGKLYKGDSYDGIDTWYKDGAGNYYWSGGVDKNLEPIIGYPDWMLDLKIPEIWKDYQEYGSMAKIAVLDTGFDINNPDIVNGVKDYKFFFQSTSGNPISINDSLGHGSHCSSLIGGKNIFNLTGCAPQSELYIAKICEQGSVKSYSTIVDAIKWAIEKQVDIISISYGGESPNDTLKATINTAVNDHNILVIAAIGDVIENSANKPCYPALYDSCLAVGATNKSNRISSVTILNNKTEINAPGENILGYMLDKITETQTGTSQAAAIVSGICALIISRHKNLGKNYTVNTIRKLIIQHFDNITDSPNQKLISPIKIFQNI
jgi:subtilisin family serine protease